MAWDWGPLMVVMRPLASSPCAARDDICHTFPNGVNMRRLYFCSFFLEIKSLVKVAAYKFLHHEGIGEHDRAIRHLWICQRPLSEFMQSALWTSLPTRVLADGRIYKAVLLHINSFIVKIVWPAFPLTVVVQT